MMRNGYLILNLTYKSGEQMEQLDKYGFLRRDYRKNHRNSTYQVMLLQDTIGKHLLEVDKAAREREEAILKQLEEKEPLPDKEAEKKMEQAEAKARNEKKRAEMEIRKTKKEVKARIEKMRDKISQMFLLGSLSGIAVLGDVIREYLLVNLIVLFVFVNMGIILIRMYLRKSM